MFTYDQAQFERQITSLMSAHYQHMKKFETGNQIIKDKYGTILGAVPYISVTLKEDADILADLAKMKHIRVVPS